MNIIMCLPPTQAYRQHVHVEYACEVASILSPPELKTRSLEPSTFPQTADSAQRGSQIEERKEEITSKYSPTNRFKDTDLQTASVEMKTQQTDPLLHKPTVLPTASRDPVYEEITDKYPVNYKITDNDPVNEENTDKYPVNVKITDNLVNEENTEWPVYVELTNGNVYGCDIIVSATGVVPNTQWIKMAGKNEKMLDVLELAEDGGIIVDSEMRSNVKNVYAAGDVCTVNWSAQSATWFPVSGDSTHHHHTHTHTHTRTLSPHTHTCTPSPYTHSHTITVMYGNLTVF